MRTTQQFSITLPQDMAEAVEGKVKSGAYASVSEVLRDGERAPLERDSAVERWLREEVVAAHQVYLADPSKGVPAPLSPQVILDRNGGRRQIGLRSTDSHRQVGEESGPFLNVSYTAESIR